MFLRAKELDHVHGVPIVASLASGLVLEGPRSSPGRLGGSFTRRDQALEASVDVKAPCARTGVETLEIGHQTEVREADLGPIFHPGDLEADLRPRPLVRDIRALEVGVDDVPDDLLARDEFSDLLLGVVGTRVAVGELVPKRVGTPLDVSGPPPWYVDDGGEDLFWRLVHGEGASEVLSVHCSLS